MPQLTVAELALACGGKAEGNGERLISGANTIDNAVESELSFADNEKAFQAAAASHAGCLIVPPSFVVNGAWALIRAERPRQAFAQALLKLYPRKQTRPGIHPTAVIARSACIGESCFIGPYVTVGEHSVLDANCSVGAGCRIGDDVVVGSGSTLHPNVTLYDAVRIGARVTLHAGCVIGADGFGFTLVQGRYEKFPQVGTVEIGDDVELGANCCVDRAALGITRIGRGTKLDNLVHVAHNCTLGEHVVVAAQTGFSGSVTVGDYAMIGGQAGIGEKAKIDAKAVIGGKAGILTSQHIRSGEPVWGIPARPLKQHLRGLAHLARLPKTEQQLKDLRKRLSALEEAQSPKF